MAIKIPLIDPLVPYKYSARDLVRPLTPYRSTEWSIWNCFIHYDRLYGLSRHMIYNYEACRWVDIYINMNSVINQIFIKNYKIFDYNGITSALINMAIHYKCFFKSKLNINSRVFIVYANNFPQSPRLLIPDYNQKNYTTYINNGELVDLIDHNRNLLDLLCKYLDGIYFIQDENQETSVLIKEIIADQIRFKRNALNNNGKVDFSAYPNIIITKDLFDYQLVATDNYTFILRPRKIEDEDKSWYVSKKNLFKAVKKELGGNVNNIPKEHDLIGSGLLPIFFAIAGLKSRNIRSIHTFNKTLEILIDAIKNNLILNEYNSDPRYCIEALAQLSPKIAENIDNIINRYNAIDVVKNQLQYHMTPDAAKIKSNIVDLVSPHGLKDINENFFSQNPIELYRLYS